MAEGGEDNPFSFKRFIKDKNKDDLSSDSAENDDSEEENAANPIENAHIPSNS